MASIYDNEGNALDEGTEKAPDVQALSVMQRAEIDGQIATAKAYPRSIAQFARDARELITADQDMAEACIYALPRGRGSDRKTITGPSARFAEILQYTFGNNRSGGRVVATDDGYITGQGVFHDLEKNVLITIEVARRITDSRGKRYNADMVGVTGNAAISIALRNAVLKGIPKPIWLPLYEAAKATAIGDIKTLPVRREGAIGWFAKVGVSLEQLLAKLEVEGLEDIGLDELELLTGWKTALRDGSGASVETMFAPEPPERAGAITGRADAATAAATVAARAAAAEGAQNDAQAADDPIKPWKAKLHLAQTKDELDEVLNQAGAELPKGAGWDELQLLYDARAIDLT